MGDNTNVIVLGEGSSGVKTYKAEKRGQGGEVLPDPKSYYAVKHWP
jgi:hypothetical protein